jgi:hypothetical protein
MMDTGDPDNDMIRDKHTSQKNIQNCLPNGLFKRSGNAFKRKGNKS